MKDKKLLSRINVKMLLLQEKACSSHNHVQLGYILQHFKAYMLKQEILRLND